MSNSDINFMREFHGRQGPLATIIDGTDPSIDADANYPLAFHGLTEQTHRYGNDNELQTLTTWTGTIARTCDRSKYWIIFIHGGAWRDPDVNMHNFAMPTIEELIKNSEYKDPLDSQPLLNSSLAGFASINYRLSAHPSQPQDPFSTPYFAYRNARHPDHIQDVLKGLSFLQQKYRITDNYLLVGHSCGATLAFQTCMNDADLGLAPNATFFSPRAILGICGIYDLKTLVDTHASCVEYRKFVEGAFGGAEANWAKVSPATYNGGDDHWRDSKLVVLVSSKGDGLIDGVQINTMEDRLGDQASENEVVVLKDLLNGGHDEIWEGNEMAGVVEKAFRVLIHFNPEGDA